MYSAPVILTPAADLDDVYYVMCRDASNMFLHIPTGQYYVELTLGYDSSKHPDQIVKDLLAQLADHEIVKDRAYD